jgi:hypothetical protein
MLRGTAEGWPGAFWLSGHEVHASFCLCHLGNAEGKLEEEGPVHGSDAGLEEGTPLLKLDLLEGDEEG